MIDAAASQRVAHHRPARRHTFVSGRAVIG